MQVFKRVLDLTYKQRSAEQFYSTGFRILAIKFCQIAIEISKFVLIGARMAIFCRKLTKIVQRQKALPPGLRLHDD